METTYLWIGTCEFIEATCDNHMKCRSQRDRNPDVAGPGLNMAFILTPWASFVFLVTAYFTGRLPTDP